MDTDAVVIGSGFGGAVAACRLAEAGYRVVVLERGRRWHPTEYPRDRGDAWIYREDDRALDGWFDVRFFPRMIVVAGAGVGGGSLVYANISAEADEATFRDGWPPEITYDELRPYYDRVGQMLAVQTVPEGQWPARTKLVRDAAAATGHEDRFRTLPLAVSFGDDPNESTFFVNPHGVEQGTCVHLGLCDLGCPVNARNTLEVNYLAVAERHGADVRAHQLARHVERVEGGYRVVVERRHGEPRSQDVVSARIVVLAAGSLGSTELLLRSRDVARTLPDLPRALGAGWSANGDFLSLAVHDRAVSPTHGPTITSAIDFRDRSEGGVPFFIEDGGFPDVFNEWLGDALTRWSFRRTGRRLRGTALALRSRPDLMPSLMPWFAQGRDAGDGRLRLRRKWLGLVGPRRLHLDWDPAASVPTIEAIAAMHARLAAATGGRLLPAPLWTLGGYLVTPHPLGGCNIGRPGRGVVDHRGEVYGHRNLFVLDGAIVPEAVGVNPSRTIAALAERGAALLVAEGR